MILLETSIGKQMILGGSSCRTLTNVIKIPEEVTDNGFCLCSYSAAPCPYYEFAITDIENPTDNYLNDYRKFLLNPLSETSTFSFVLIEKDSTEHVVYSETESTTDFGAIFEQGFNESQPLQIGVNIIWHNVVSILGYGDYTIKLSQTDFGTETTETTHVFRVIKHNAVRINGTVKIEIDNVGVTMNGKNWTGLFTDKQSMFTNMIRVNGRLMLTDPEIVRESIEDGSRKENPVQTKVTDTYLFNIERIPFDLGYSLIHESIVMNWRVTDYNVFNDNLNLRNKEMLIESSSVTNIPDYARKTYELTAKTNLSKLNRRFI
jgi:hypothetical protein